MSTFHLWAVGLGSVGRGKRSANIFAENQNLFSSSRQINILNSGGKIYGLNPEIAWNYGLSVMKNFRLLGGDFELVVDYYITDFKNQVLIDWEELNRISFYNLEGKSSSKSFQLGLDYKYKQFLSISAALHKKHENTSFTNFVCDKQNILL